MQNIGFVYTILPGLKDLCPDGYEKSANRYLRFFNTHPYMAPTVAGVFLRLEEQGDTETIEKLKQTISSSLAAIGDSFFWATLKPMIALMFLLAVMLGQVWGAVLTFILYNIIHIWTMAWGFSRGYSNGPGGALEIGKILSVDRSRRLSQCIPLAAGMVLAALAQWNGIGHGLLFCTAVFLASVVAFRLKLGVFWIFYGVFTLILVWTIIR